MKTPWDCQIGFLRKHHWTNLLAGALLSAVAFAAQAQSPETVKESPPPSPGTPNISGPHSYHNLAFYVVEGQHQPEHDELLTLEEAMKQNLVKVHETGKVSELAVENLAKRRLFIQAGDIVKGGKQDRTLGVDLILAAKSGRVPIQSFCVESGRWQARGGESLNHFSSSSNALPGKTLKAAARYNKKQDKVWSLISRGQSKLKEKAGAKVIADDSPTSMELTMNSKQLREKTKAYQNKLGDVLAEHPQATGIVVAINGQLNSADLYQSPVLLKKLWPKLSQAAMTEAVAEAPKEAESFTWPTTDDVASWLQASTSDAPKITQVSATMSEAVREGKDYLSFESQTTLLPGTWVRQNALFLTPEEMKEIKAKPVRPRQSPNAPTTPIRR